jgi:hypothetical protein
MCRGVKYPTRCPIVTPPVGLLYNHVSKTGGTTMEQLLLALKRMNANLTVVVQPDTQQKYVTAQHRDRFFVIGTARPPCAFALSLWSFRSDHVLRRTRAGSLWAMEHGRDRYGLAPPFNTSADRERFAHMARTEPPRLAQRGPGINGLEAYYRTRMGRPAGSLLDGAHCWVRSDGRFGADFRRCLDEYVACGGQKLRAPLVPHANTGHHLTCAEYFAGLEGVEALLMNHSSDFKFDGSMGRLFDGSCC